MEDADNTIIISYIEISPVLRREGVENDYYLFDDPHVHLSNCTGGNQSNHQFFHRENILFGHDDIELDATSFL